MSIENILPVEVWGTVLQHCFHIHVDKEFSQPYSPFSPLYSRTESRLLLVCKEWYRVGIPLLYETVAIKSDNGMWELAATIDSNPDLGLMIRNLRLDGGYGLRLHALLKCTPNVENLSLHLDVGVGAPVTGFLRCIPGSNSLKPKALYVHQLLFAGNRHNSLQNLVNAAWEAIMTWTSLECIMFSDNVQHIAAIFPPELLPSIEASPSLSEIGFCEDTLGILLRNPNFRRIVRQKGIRTLACYGVDIALDPYLEDPSITPDIRSLVVYRDYEGDSDRRTWIAQKLRRRHETRWGLGGWPKF